MTPVRVAMLNDFKVRFFDDSDPATYRDIHGRQIKLGDVVKTSQGITYLAMINPATSRLEFKRQEMPPGVKVVWWFYSELDSPEIVSERLC